MKLCMDAFLLLSYAPELCRQAQTSSPVCVCKKMGPLRQNELVLARSPVPGDGKEGVHVRD
jgi:hypothetical protein